MEARVWPCQQCTMLIAKGKICQRLANAKDTHHLLKSCKGSRFPLSVVVGIDVSASTADLLFIGSLLK